MPPFKLVWRNLLRRPLRSVLTVLSLSIAVFIASESSSKSLAVLHVFSGASVTRMSVLSLPTGSVATSARPVIASDFFTSGKPCSTRSASRSRRRASSSEMLGARRMVTTASPSKMRGTNSAPERAKSQPAITSATAEAPIQRRRPETTRGRIRS